MLTLPAFCPLTILRAGWKSSELWGLVAVLLIIVGVIAFEKSAAVRGIAMAAGPAAWAFYQRNRGQLKKLALLIDPATGIPPMDFDALIDSTIQKFVASKIPASVSLQPETDAAIAAVEALARKAIQVYALKAILPKLSPAVQTEIKTLFPALA